MIQKCQPPELDIPQLKLGAQVASSRIWELSPTGVAATSAAFPKLA